MEVKNCKNCGRLYNYIGGVYRLCPECMRKLEEKFQEVKDYIEDNPRADMREISEKCDVSTRQIEQWIRFTYWYCMRSMRSYHKNRKIL